MGDCKYCGKPSGWLSSLHKECQTKYDLGEDKIITMLDTAIHKNAMIDSLKADLEDIADKHWITKAILPSIVINGWEKAVDGAFEDGVLTEQEELNLVEVQKHFGFDQYELDKKGAYTKMVKGGVLRDLLNGNLPQRINIEGNIPFNLQKDERLVWIFQEVQYYERKTRRHIEGRSSGVSLRVARGVYYRTGGFRGYPVETTENVHSGTGLLGFTTKHIYFSGSLSTFRIPYKKIVSFIPYSDGIGLQRDAASAKPQTFITGDGWFAYNLAVNLSQFSQTVKGN